jgi:hypothetical protein
MFSYLFPSKNIFTVVTRDGHSPPSKPPSGLKQWDNLKKRPILFFEPL